MLVADTRFIALAVRRDASVDFSEDALFSVDGVAARVTMRVDWALERPLELRARAGLVQTAVEEHDSVPG